MEECGWESDGGVWKGGGGGGRILIFAGTCLDFHYLAEYELRKHRFFTGVCCCVIVQSLVVEAKGTPP